MNESEAKQLLQGMLNNPDTMEKLESVLSGPQGGMEPEPVPDPISDSMAKLGQLYGQISNQNDPRINLLSAMRPYLNGKRQTQMNRAIQMIQLSRMASAAKTLHFFQ